MRNPFAAKPLRSICVTLIVTTLLVIAGTTGFVDAAAEDITIPRVPNPQPSPDLLNLPGDLRAIPVPTPSGLNDIVRDPAMAIALGKALFWDMQVGSDGVQACASCHFRAGADPRSKNQLSPGLKHMPAADLLFANGRGPNYQLSAADFPFTQLAIPNVRGLLGPTDSNDVVSSQGIHHPAPAKDPLGFLSGSTNTRRVEPRNTPTVINAVFNHRQFWDGRAENIFNGVNHVGKRDPNARVFRADDPKKPEEVSIELTNASLASQAVAPIVSDLEMAFPGRTQLDVALALAKGQRDNGKRLDNVRPLNGQLVSPTDSVLGPMSRWPNKGLAFNRYDDMIKKAFFEWFWRSKMVIRFNDDGSKTLIPKNGGQCEEGTCGENEYSLLQSNFPLFFGIAIQLYEATLVSDDTPWDRFRRQHPLPSDPALNPWTNTSPAHISRLALFGAALFNDRTRGATNIRCSNCHESNELTDNSVRRVALATVNGPVRNRDGNIIDKGFNNIGIRPTDNDLGVGASDVFGKLSHASRRFPTGLSGAINKPCTTATVATDCPATFTCDRVTNLCAWDGTVLSKGFGTEGAFKVPSVRNVALTAPYFHDGGTLTLREVVELYSRGGNVAPIAQLDGTPIEPLGIPLLTSNEIDAIVAFLEALTDERVLYRRAPFDHPQLFVPNGHPGTSLWTIDANNDGLADDMMIEIPAVGAAGGDPIPGFLQGIFAP